LKILLVISQWSPAQTPNTLRWKPLLEQFRSSGHEPFVLTTLRSGYESGQLIDGINIYRAGYNTLLDKYYDKKGSKNRRNEFSNIQGGSSIFSRIKNRIVNTFWRKRYWPDGSQLFIEPGIELCEQIVKENEISHIISVGLPFSAHLIARQIKNSNRDIYWHMDIQDPFSYSKEFRVIFDNCDDKEYNVIAGNGMVHIGYAGSFYEKVREPLKFIEFINRLNDSHPEMQEYVQFHFFGQIDSRSFNQFRTHPQVKRYFIFHGFMTREEALSGLEQMNIVMNFGNTTDYHLPSKVVDYLYLNKPLINWISNPDDSTKKFLNSKDIEMSNINLEEVDFEISMKQFNDFVFQKREEGIKDIKRVEAFLPKSIADQYLELLT